jgi:ubiquitin carboxyl-terminal hydrolase 14
VGWTRSSDKEWTKFDDDKVSTVSVDEVRKLDGGGDFHMAYICIYRLKKKSHPGGAGMNAALNK